MTDTTAINVRGSMKQILREYFPDLSIEKTEEIAERMADAARDYSRAMAPRITHPGRGASPVT